VLRDDGEPRQAVFDQGRDDLAAKRELRDERGWDLGAGCRHGNPVIWRAWGVPKAPIANDQNNVRVSSALEVLPGECVRQWIDLDELYRGYAKYAQRTNSIRTIPMLRLTPAR
jgi:hypothetical protein